jgi:hypothetical protein
MPPDPQTPPAPAPAPAGTEDRLQAVEAEQARQGGLLEQILDRLPGKAPAGGQGGRSGPDPAPGGKSVAEQVREGIEALERERAAAAEADAAKQAREDHAARLAALEERVPNETAATPVGAFKAKVQRVMFGIDQAAR